ncbi:Voltage-gated Ion Channel (VIC) Superfamily, partial [Thraustotheca clavata]
MFVNHLECGYENVSCGTHNSWAAKNKLVGPKLLHTYLYTLVVVGYGFPSPETNIERVLVISIQFCRFLGGVSIISAFVFLFERQNRRRNLFSDKIDKIKEFLKLRQVSSDIKVKVLDFYEHFWTAQRGLEEDLIVASLPSHIQTCCLHHLRVRLLKSVPIVRAQPIHILNRLAILMRRMAYSPRDWILHDEPSEYLFLVCRGRIAILHPNSTEIHSYVLDGQFFGLSMMAPESKTRIRARAETYCDLYTLTRQNFVDVWMLCNPKNGPELVQSMMEGIRQYLQAPHQITLSHLSLNHKVYDDNLWFMPRSRFRMYWEWGILIALLYFSVDIPYRLCFEASTYFNPYIFSLSSVFDVFLLMDVVLCSRFFAFVQDDVVVTNPKRIFAHYRANGLVLDCISNIPFATVIDCLSLEFKTEHIQVAAALHMCEWLRFLRMRRLLPTITQVLKKLHVDDTTFVIVYLFFCVPLVCHVGSCVWYFLATWDAQDILSAEHWNAEVNLTRIDCLTMARQFNNCTWLLFDNVEFGESADYVRAFYWSVVSLVTVQFGSIFPFTTVECAYMFFWLFFGSIMNYGAIGGLVNAVTRMNAATEAKEEHLMLVHRFMHSEGVSRRVHRDVSSYFKHRWTQSTEQEILLALQPLPDNLRQSIQSYLYSKAVAHVQIFHLVDKDELKYIYAIMSHRTYKKDEILVRAGDIGEELFIITRGSVELTLPINGIPISVLVIHAGACIGEAQFMPRTIYPLTSTVVSPSIDVSVLNRADFDTIIKHLESSIEDIEAQASKVIEKELAWLASIRKNLDRRKIQHSMHRANSKGLFTDTSSSNRFIEPTMSLYRFWQVLILIIVLYNFISIAYRVAFLLYPSTDIMFAFNILDYSTDAVFLIDMYIKFNHLTYSDRYGDQVINHKLIRSHYIWKGSFKLDLFSSLPLYYVGDYGIMTLCRLPRLARCFRLPRLWDDISLLLHELISSERIAEYLEFYKLFVVLVLASHLAATGLYFISSTEVHYSHVEEEHIWFEGDEVIQAHHSNFYIMYLRSFYWGLGVLSSFDYMDIEMALLAETVWFCVVAISGVLFLGIVIGQTSSVINNANKDSRDLEHQIDRFTTYCNYQGLPRYLLERGKLFFRFQHDCNKGIDAHQVFADLPHTLRLDLFKDLYTSWVRNVPYFTPLPPAQIYGIAEKLRVQLFLPGDDIILEGDVATHFFIMKRGRGEKYLKAHMLVFGPVYEGLIFGEDAFFLGTRYTYCIRAVKCSEVLCLPLTEWNSMWSAEVRVEVEWRIKKQVQADCSAMKHAIQAITRNFGVAPGMRIVPVKLRTLILQGMHKSANPYWNIALDYAQRQAQTSIVDVHGSMTGALVNHKLVDLVRLQQDITKSIHVHPAAHAQSERVIESIAPMGELKKVVPQHHEDVGVSVQKNHPVLPFESLSIWHRDAPPQAMWIPHSGFRETWDILCWVAVLYYSIALPFRA